MSESENITKAFSRFVSAMENETKTLQGLTYLRSLNAESMTARSLFELDEKVTTLEENFDILEALIDEEYQCLELIQRLTTESLLQTEGIERISSRIELDEDQNVPLQNQNEIAEIGIEEFERIPKTTKGRLVLSQINSCLRSLISMTSEKEKSFKVKRSKINKKVAVAFDDFLSRKVPEHESKMFLTEGEIRLSPVFESGESTGRAILQTMRALQRLRLVRSGGENTYIVQ